MVIIPGVEADDTRLAAICDKYGIAELAELFGHSVDLVSLHALHPRNSHFGCGTGSCTATGLSI